MGRESVAVCGVFGDCRAFHGGLSARRESIRFVGVAAV